MLTWFSENVATIIAGVLVAAVLGCVIYSMARNKRQGKSSCGCGGCAGGCCHK